MFHVWMSFGLLFAILGLLGSILPILPGIILSLIGMIMIEFGTGSGVDFSTTQRLITSVLVILAMVSDYIFPLLGAKRSGGTKAGERGSILGMIAGFFFPPRGLILGPILGAFCGEYITQKDTKKAIKSARGSFLGSTASTLIKIIGCGFIVWYIIGAWI